MQVVSAGIFSLWSHSETLPVCRAIPAMACGKRTTPVAAHITDEVMGTGPCLVGGAAAAVASAEPEKGGVGTFSSELPFHDCGPRELQQLTGAPPPSRADLYRCHLRDDRIEWSNNMYWCLAALDEEQTVVLEPVSRDGAFCTKATVVGQSTDGPGEAAVSERFTGGDCAKSLHA